MRDLGRLAVVLGVVSATVHGVLAVGALHRSLIATVLLVVMGAACLSCAPSLWRGGSVHSWMTMLGLSGAMLFLHVQLCMACGLHEYSDLGIGIGAKLLGQGLGSVAIWLMLAEIVLASAAVVRLVSHQAHPLTDNREVALS